MNAQHRHSSGAGGSSSLSALAALLVAWVACSADLGLHLAGKTATWNPLVLALLLGRGRVHWPTSASLIAGGILLAPSALVLLFLIRRRGPAHPDRAARLMATRRDLKPVSLRESTRKAGRLGMAAPGLPVAEAVSGGLIYADWEAMQTDIAGPRRCKTSGRAIPTLLSAPGAGFATSNKPDLYASTRLLRERSGTVWNLDPQCLAGGRPDWWWNPLGYVTSLQRAIELTDTFVGAYRHPKAHTDAFFEPAGAALVSMLLLAAAADGRPITDAYRWTLDPNVSTVPAGILRAHSYDLAASSVTSTASAPHDQRAGVYGTAERILAFLANPDTAAWVCDTADRAQLDLDAFVRSADTLYLHSKEGRGSSAGVVSALAMALCDAAERYARVCSSGRLPVPLVGVLDEAANICRWPELPNLYSHYGSRGIVLLTLLQSWSQGAEAWGEAGMEKLWGAANVKCYGGGSDEDKYLGRLERLIGDYDRVVLSTSSRRDGQSTSRQTTRTSILTVADLRALPRDRLVAFPSGVPPVLARPLYWWESPWAADVRESQRLYDPAGS